MLRSALRVAPLRSPRSCLTSTRAALMGEWKINDKVVTRTWSLAFDLLLK